MSIPFEAIGFIVVVLVVVGVIAYRKNRNSDRVAKAKQDLNAVKDDLLK